MPQTDLAVDSVNAARIVTPSCAGVEAAISNAQFMLSVTKFPRRCSSPVERSIALNRRSAIPRVERPYPGRIPGAGGDISR